MIMLKYNVHMPTVKAVVYWRSEVGATAGHEEIELLQNLGFFFVCYRE